MISKTVRRYIWTLLAVSWVAAGVAIALGMRRTTEAVYLPFASSYMLLPALITLIFQRISGEDYFRNLGISFRWNRWFAAASLLPIAITFLALALNLFIPGVSFSLTYEGLFAVVPEEQARAAIEKFSSIHPALFLILQVVQSIIAGLTINAFFAFGEELGWRGYLLRELSGVRFLPASLFVGFVWGLWHAPIIALGHNYPQHPIAGIGMMVLWCMLLSPPITYITLKARSVIAAAVFHGTLNAIAGISYLYLVGGNDLTNGVTGVSGFAALLLINAALFWRDQKSGEKIWSRPINFLDNSAEEDQSITRSRQGETER